MEDNREDRIEGEIEGGIREAVLVVEEEVGKERVVSES